MGKGRAFGWGGGSDATAISGLASIAFLGNVFFVSPSGSDITGVKGRIDKPFLTIAGAEALAVAGDIIYGFDGSYKVMPLADAVTILVPAHFGLSNELTVTLGGNRTLGAPSNPADGQKITMRVKQDAVGGRTLAFDPIYRFGTDIPSIVLSTAPLKTDYFGIIYNATDVKWDVVALTRGF
jgi:hypothetical protein